MDYKQNLFYYKYNKKILLLKELELSYNYLYNGIKIYKIIVIINLDYCIFMETKKNFFRKKMNTYSCYCFVC